MLLKNNCSESSYNHFKNEIGSDNEKNIINLKDIKKIENFNNTNIFNEFTNVFGAISKITDVMKEKTTSRNTKKLLSYINLLANNEPNSTYFMDILKSDKLINFDYLCNNQNAIGLLKKNTDFIIVNEICKNKNLIKLIDNISIDEITDEGWYHLSSNEYAIDILKQYKHKIYWNELSENKNAIDLILEKIKQEKNNNIPLNYRKGIKGSICYLSLSKNLNIMKLIKNNENIQKNLNWHYLSSNPNAIELLKNNKEKIVISSLCLNKNFMELEDFMKENYHKIDWCNLSSNINAIGFLKDKIKKENLISLKEYNKLHFTNVVDYYNLSSNENAIELIKEKIKEENSMDINEYNRLCERKINYESLASNSNKKAIELVDIYLQKIDDDELKHKIYKKLCFNNNNSTIELIMKYLSKLNNECEEYNDIYNNLCLNPNAIFLIETKIFEKYNQFKGYNKDPLKNNYKYFLEFLYNKKSDNTKVPFWRHFFLVKNFYNIYIDICKICKIAIDRDKLNIYFQNCNIHESWITIFKNLCGSDSNYLAYGRAFLDLKSENKPYKNIMYMKSKY